MSDADFYKYLLSIFPKVREYIPLEEDGPDEPGEEAITNLITIDQMAESSTGMEFFVRTKDAQFQVGVEKEKDEASCYALELRGYVVYLNSLEDPVALQEGFNLMFYYYIENVLKEEKILRSER